MSNTTIDGSRPPLLVAWSSTAIHGLGLLLWSIAYAIFFVLHFLYRPVAFLSQPLVYLAQFLLACVALPFHILVKFETVYIYLGVAAIVGVTGGLLIRSLSTGLSGILGLNVEPAPKGRTVKQYRQSKRKQGVDSDSAFLSQASLSPDPVSPGYLSLSDGSRSRRRHKSLLAQTIMEEEDSDI